MAGQEILYMKIFNYIKGLIEDGTLKPGDRIPTEMELAEEFKVSRITAIRAANELERSGYVYRVRKKGTIVNSPVLHNNTGNSQPVIPMILPFGEPFQKEFGANIGYELLTGAQSEAQKRNCMITLYNTEQTAAREREVLEMLLELNLFGIIVYPTDDYSYDNIAVYSKYLIKKTPMVFLDHPPLLANIPCITSDNETGMYELVSRLIRKGHTKIAYYCDSLTRYPNQASRFKGFSKAMIEAGVTLNNQYVFEFYLFRQQYDKLSLDGKADMSREEYCINGILDKILAMDDPPTAIVCVNDLSAVALQREAIKRGIRIPEDFSLTGFDNLSIDNHLIPPLTSVSQNLYEIGRKSVQLLFDIKEGKPVHSDYKMKTAVVERDSVADINGFGMGSAAGKEAAI